MWKTVVFDLDGTLTDSGEGIKKSILYALEKMGREPLPDEALNAFVGPPLPDSFRQFAHLEGADVDEAVRLYRERYFDIGIFENEVYPGIENCLKTLKEAGFRLAVASSKPQVMVYQVLEHFGLDGYFDVIVGSELDGTRVKKHEVIEEALARLSVTDRSEVVYVGDRKFDVNGARQTGLEVIGVLYGYGSYQEMLEHGPDYLAADPDMVLDIIMEKLVHAYHKPVPGQDYVPVGESKWKSIWRVLYPILIDLVIVNGISLLAIPVILVGEVFGHNLSTERELYNIFMVTGLIGDVILIFLGRWLLKLDEARRLTRPIPQGRLEQKWHGIREWLPRALFFIIFFIATAEVANILIDMSGIWAIDPAYQAATRSIFDTNLIIQVMEVGFVGPIAEEMIFRGLVFRRIRDYRGPKTAILLSAALFGLYHGNVTQGIFAFALGVVMAWAYEESGDIRMSVMMHVANNLLATALTAFANEAFFSTPYYVVNVTVLAVMCGMILWYRRRNRRKAAA
ncbi:MAG: HAD hydrolase-like protein [Lachnospiraceae bacterium]|nr:HAD hydrolase-like protein [Lachnospiraceae bacterium]